MNRALTRGIKYVCAGSLAVFAAAASGAQPATYPDRPIRLLVGFAAGSGTDTVGRVVGEILAKELGQSAIVENKTGANGSLAVQTVARAKPDGYTLLISNTSSMTVNPLINKELGYDPVEDFEPIATILSYPLVLTVNASAEKTKNVRTVQDLVDLAKSQKEPLTYGSAGIGNLFHIAGVQFANAAGIEATHVPYRGGTPMRAAMMGGQIDFTFDTLDIVPAIKDGRVRGLAVTERERWRDLPDIPTTEEVGFPSIQISPWYGLLAPKGTPPEILAKLHDALSVLNSDETMRKKLELIGRVQVTAPEELAGRLKNETAINRELLIREGVIQP